MSANGYTPDALGLTPANGFRPSGFSTLPVARGTRRANESVKKQKDINNKSFSFVLAFESLAGRAKGTVLIFCFVLHQGKMKNNPKGCVRKIEHLTFSFSKETIYAL
ncbi:hypothetical protein G7051_05230 [Dysgonomonas sp. HDW5B]|uniref:hypothetical protein n=1 Tax=Dysgonomonas sp. HDW5B TaxID=2714927 RepID=UPI00140CD395|nr:hypothetical protein [Dysgonomonas sp. HDW5B]QIK53776.1 hypothetical protein G7051_05230 [Dysgonomonas sp. HDW5B]